MNRQHISPHHQCKRLDTCSHNPPNRINLSSNEPCLTLKCSTWSSLHQTRSCTLSLNQARRPRCQHSCFLPTCLNFSRIIHSSITPHPSSPSPHNPTCHLLAHTRTRNLALTQTGSRHRHGRLSNALSILGILSLAVAALAERILFFLLLVVTLLKLAPFF